MIDLADIGLRASVVVLAALGASAALRHRSAALRHWVLAAGIFSSAAVAPLGMTLPAWDLPAPPAQVADPGPAGLRPLEASGAAPTARPIPAPTAAGTRVSAGQAITILWTIGFGASVLILLIRLGRIVVVTRRAEAVTDRRWIEASRELAARLNVRSEVVLLKTGMPGLVGTWGWRRACILLPAHCESWPDDRRRIVLGHELAHVRRADWPIQVAAELVRAAFWYNPLFWVACARLRREGEQACDNAVLEAGVPAAEYASHLLAIARSCRPSAWSAVVVPMARPSTLEWRITAMLNTTLIRRRPTRRAMALAIAVLVAVAVPAATFRAHEQTGPMPLTGVLYDMTGAVLPQVALMLEDAAGVQKAASTDSAGRFDFGAVAPGRYMLTSTLAGFLSITQEVRLEEARQWERTITLQVGTLQETITVREQRPSGAPAAQRGPVRIGGNIRPPRKLLDVRPVYPQAMRDAGLEGVVPLGALIGVDGRVSSVRVISAHAHPELAQAALEAVRQWRFSPTLLNGTAVEVFMTVTVSFSLED